MIAVYNNRSEVKNPVSADERGKESIDSDNGTDFIPNSLTSLGIRDDVTKKYI